MKTTPEALKDLYVAMGNSAEAVADLNQNVDVLNAFAEAYQGSGDAVTIPEAIDNITAVAGNIGGGGGAEIATVTATCTNADVVDIGIYYSIYVDDMDYSLNNGNGWTIGEDGVELFVGGDSTYATFYGTYEDSSVNLVIESVTGDGEIKTADDFKWLEVHGDCAVTLSYTQ